MKAFKDVADDIYLLDLDNWERFNSSAKRLATLEVPEEVFMKV
jgi:hypothetical protein